jgi:hypothetical protein
MGAASAQYLCRSRSIHAGEARCAYVLAGCCFEKASSSKELEVLVPMHGVR